MTSVFGIAADTALLTALSGALVGLLLAVFGGGGSILATPLLIYLVGVSDTHLAIGTSAAGVAAIALFNLAGHWRAGRVKWPCALTFAAAGFLGSVVGSSLAKATGDSVLLLAFAGAMAAVGLAMLRKPREAPEKDVRISLPVAMRLVPTGGAVGTAAGFFGIGGGFLIVPGLIGAAGMTIAQAAAASLVSVAVFGAATSANYALSGLVDPRLTALLLLGGGIGGFAGMRIAGLLSGRERLARSLFAGMVILVALYVGVDAGTQLLQG